VDEYRKRLPTDKEIDRFNPRSGEVNLNAKNFGPKIEQQD